MYEPETALAERRNFLRISALSRMCRTLTSFWGNFTGGRRGIAKPKNAFTKHFSAIQRCGEHSPGSQRFTFGRKNTSKLWEKLTPPCFLRPARKTCTSFAAKF